MARKPNILHIMTYPNGGAANAAIRLHKSLLQNGYNSNILSLNKSESITNFHWHKESCVANKYSIIAKRRVLKQKQKSLLKGQETSLEKFSIQTSPYNIHKQEAVKNADIINLHWVTDYINYQTFFGNINKPVVWTIHDMNPFTGGCHYSFECENFKSDCSNCPQIRGIENKNFAKDNVENIQQSVKGTNLTIVSPSEWLKNQSQQSHAFKNKPHYTIPNGINSNVFKTQNKKSLQEELGLPTNKKLILFIADYIDHYRKGVKYIIEASEKLNDDYRFILVGRGDFKSNKFINMGFVSSEEQIAKIYGAADLFVIPSLADNLPNTVLESLFCGTPVVGFNIGGMPDMVIHGENGMLCNEISSKNLADTIENTVNSELDHKKIAKNVIAKFSVEKQYIAYNNLYQKILNNE